MFTWLINPAAFITLVYSNMTTTGFNVSPKCNKKMCIQNYACTCGYYLSQFIMLLAIHTANNTTHGR